MPNIAAHQFVHAIWFAQNYLHPSRRHWSRGHEILFYFTKVPSSERYRNWYGTIHDFSIVRHECLGAMETNQMLRGFVH
jgi:hypothetical protein